MKSFTKNRLTTRTLVFTLAIALSIVSLRAVDVSAASAFDKEKKTEKKKDDDKAKKKKDKDDDKDEDVDDKDDDDADVKKEKKESKDKDDDDKDKDDDKDDDEDKDDDDKDDDEDKDDDDKDDEDKDDDDKDEDEDKEKGGEIASVTARASEKSSEAMVSAAETSPSSEMISVQATIETVPVPVAGDAADDPAIWIDSSNPSRSAIIGSNKLGGLAVYSLDGKQIQYLADGLMNNVDLRMGFPLGGQATAIITASNRKDNSIAIYRLNPATRMLENVAARKIVTTPAYGSCLYRSPKTGKFYYFVTGKSGDVEQWELYDASGKVDAKRVRGFKLGSTVEGCVADDELGHLYISEEVVGIWKFDAEPAENAKGVLIDKAGSGGRLTADVEGLTIAYGKDGAGYLIASSQGNNSFVIYQREGNNQFVKAFRITPGNDIDGVEETDGLDVTTANLGPAFPHGVLVVQDGINDKGNQNFKLVPLQHIFAKP